MLALSQSTEELVQRGLAKGRFKSADDLVRTAVAMLDEIEEADADVREGIAEAIAQLDRGEGTPLRQFEAEVRAMDAACSGDASEAERRIFGESCVPMPPPTEAKIDSLDELFRPAMQKWEAIEGDKVALKEVLARRIAEFDPSDGIPLAEVIAELRTTSARLRGAEK